MKSNGRFLNQTIFFSDENLEYLFVDTPPGTSDEHLSIVQYLADAGKQCFIVRRILKACVQVMLVLEPGTRKMSKKDINYSTF